MVQVGLGDVTADIQQTLSAAGVPPGQIQTAIQAYTGLSSQQAQSVTTIATSLANGQTPSIATFTPLIAGALAATGIGAPVVAIVAAAIPIIGGLVDLLGFNSTPQTCAWQVGGLCFNGVRPYGPIDPSTGTPNPMWIPWPAFTQGIDLQLATPQGFGGSSNPNDDRIDNAFPWYRQTIACELTGALVTATDPLSMFLKTYYAAWQARAEYAINGHPTGSEYDLLIQTVNAWNASHTGPMVAITANPGPAQRNTFCMPQGVTFVSILLSGQIDGNQHSDITIGTKTVHVLKGPGGEGASDGGGGAPSPSGPMSTGVKVAIAIAAVPAVVSLGAIIYALVTRQAVSHVFGKMTDYVKGTLKKGYRRLRGKESPSRKSNPLESQAMHVQSLLFSRSKFTPAKAKAWARGHGYGAPKVDITDRYIRIRQEPPSKFRILRTVTFGHGIKAVVGR